MPAELNGAEVNGNAHLAQSSSICINKQYRRLAARLSSRTQAQLEDSGATASLAYEKHTQVGRTFGNVSSDLQRVSCPFHNKANKKKLCEVSQFVCRALERHCRIVTAGKCRFGCPQQYRYQQTFDAVLSSPSGKEIVSVLC